MRKWNLELIIFIEEFEICFDEIKFFFQPMDRVCTCVEQTYSNVISAPLSVRRPEISQVFGRCAVNF